MSGDLLARDARASSSRDDALATDDGAFSGVIATRTAGDCDDEMRVGTWGMVRYVL